MKGELKMKLTKLVHSCLIAEKSGKKILVDPGNYSWQSGLVDSPHMVDIDAIVVTHGHPDHLSQEFATALLEHSPSAQWYGPQQVVDRLTEWGIDGKTFSDDTDVDFVVSKHTDLAPWFAEQPEHTSYLLFKEVLVSGDCHTLIENHGARILAGAVNGGPWGSVLGFTRMVESMNNRTNVVVPLHDWHWNDVARSAIYGQLPDVLAKFDVEFVALENSVAKEV